MTELHRSIDTYLEAYSEADAARRNALVARVWAEHGRLVDPPLEATGRAEISGMAAILQSHYPGHQFRRSSEIDGHHGFARYDWELVAADGTVTLSGIDIAEVGEDGLLRQVVGFLGPIPSRKA